MKILRVRLSPRRPVYHTLAFVLACASVGAVMWTLLGRYHSGGLGSRAGQSRGAQVSMGAQQGPAGESTVLLRDNGALKKRLVALERGNQVDQATIIGLHKEIQTLDGEIRKLRREVAFYEGMMDAPGNSSGLRIQGLLLEPMNAERHYRYKLILIRAAKDDKLATGTVEISVEGTQGDAKKTLALRDIRLGDTFGDTPSDTSKLAFELKNFAQIKGGLALPEGFAPANVRVRAKLKGKGRSTPTEREFDWPSSEEKK